MAETIGLAAAAGLAGCSVEDFTRRPGDPIYDLGLARERVAAAAAAAAAAPGPLVLTARAENYLHGRPDLADTIRRLQAYQEAGADVLYAPGLTSLADIRAVVSSVDRPVNVLTLRGRPVRAAAGRGGRAPDLGGVGVLQRRPRRAGIRRPRTARTGHLRLPGPGRDRAARPPRAAFRP